MKRLLIALMMFAFPAAAQEILVPLTSYTMGFDATSRKVTWAFGPQTQFARVLCTQDCYIAFASSNTSSAATAYAAGTTSVYVPANTPEVYRVQRNGWVAVIRVTTNGTFSVTELTK